MRAIAIRVKELTGLPLHDGGNKAEERLRKEDGSRSIICSIQSNGRGRDGLQLIFNKQLAINWPSSATLAEQILGRTSRQGQKHELVTMELYGHTPEVRKAVIQSMKRSEYVRDIMRSKPKLLAGWKEAKWVLEGEEK